jgi:hypothetical protein
MESSRFDLGYCILNAGSEHLFLSVTQKFEYGPGIHRDGKSEPRMLDPHVLGSGKMTAHAFVQRAGTWTIYHHVKHFVQLMGNRWRVLGAQSNGDLTMNPWHVAYLGESALNARKGTACALLLENDNREPVETRQYRCLIKWTETAAERCGRRYEFLDVSMEPRSPMGDTAKLRVHPSWVSEIGKTFWGVPGYAGRDDISSLVEFALSGKPLIERKAELALPNVIDRFQDIRHIFNLPMIPTGQDTINLGEYQLFQNLNERRAALYAPVVVDLEIPDHVPLTWEKLRNTLEKQIHFTLTERSPTKRGEFRWYPGSQPRIEIFFHPGVYPFGSLGMRESSAPAAGHNEIVSLSCGGLSGRLGNTLEGVSRMMYDYFRCDDAIVLDEGLDVCLIVNDRNYSNEQILHKLWSFTQERYEKDHIDSLKRAEVAYANGMKNYPLNELFTRELETDYQEPVEYRDVFRVTPGRSQIRSMLIFAEERSDVSA